MRSYQQRAVEAAVASRHQRIVAAMVPGRRLTVDEFTEKLVHDYSGHMLDGFLREFGYVNPDATTTLSALRNAVVERGPRIERELSVYKCRT